MSTSNSKLFSTPKSSKTSRMINVTHDITPEVPVKTSTLTDVRYSWLTFVLGMIAVAGICGTVGIAIVSFVVLRETTSTSEFLFLNNIN